MDKSVMIQLRTAVSDKHVWIRLCKAWWNSNNCMYIFKCWIALNCKTRCKVLIIIAIYFVFTHNSFSQIINSCHSSQTVKPKPILPLKPSLIKALVIYSSQHFYVSTVVKITDGHIGTTSLFTALRSFADLKGGLQL